MRGELRPRPRRGGAARSSGVAVEPGGEPAVEGQPGLDLLEPGRGRRPSRGRGRAGCRRPRGSRRPGARGRRRPRPSSGTGPGDRLERPRDALRAALAPSGRPRRARRSPRRRRCGAARRWPGGGPRAPALVLAGAWVGGGQLVALELEQGPLPLPRRRPPRSARAACAARPRAPAVPRDRRRPARRVRRRRPAGPAADPGRRQRLGPSNT